MTATRRAELPARRLHGRLAALVWLVVAADLIGLGLAVLVTPDLPMVVSIIMLGVVGSFGIVGATVATRMPRNPIGWILWLTAAAIAWSLVGVTYANFSLAYRDSGLPGTVAVAFLANLLFVPVFGVVGMFVPLLFPDGHLPSPRWRGVAWLAAIAIALSTFGYAFTPGPMSGGAEIENPIGIEGLAPLLNVLSPVAFGAMALSFVLAIASVIWRYRRGSPVERQQLRWFGSAALLMLIAIGASLTSIGPLADIGWLVLLAGIALMPIATGIAILRYRLYDLDRLISRTIGYAVVTSMLVIAYALVILLLQGPLDSITGGDTISVAISTLVVAALFQPLRRRIQAVVDRRFDRARFDGARTSAGFSARVRDEVDITAVMADLEGTIQGALRPTTIGLWLRRSAE